MTHGSSQHQPPPSSAAPDSLAIREAYTRDYFLSDCGGYETYRQSGGKALDLRLECMARLAAYHPAFALWQHTPPLERQPPLRPLRILDLGCGRGEIVRYFAAAGHQVVGIDYAEEAIRLAEDCFADEPAVRAGVTLLCASVTDPHSYQGQYDLVLASDVIEHLAPAELTTVYALVRQHLQPDGVFLIHTFPNHWYYRYGYPWRRRRAARRGEVLPEQPRSVYELHMHINEQTPNRMRRQLAAQFAFVQLWAGDHHNPVGSLRGQFSHHDWRDAPSLFAVAAQQPINCARLIQSLTTQSDQAVDTALDPSTAVSPESGQQATPPPLVQRMVRRLRRYSGLRRLLDRLYQEMQYIAHKLSTPHQQHLQQEIDTLRREHRRLSQAVAALRVWQSMQSYHGAAPYAVPATHPQSSTQAEVTTSAITRTSAAEQPAATAQTASHKHPLPPTDERGQDPYAVSTPRLQAWYQAFENQFRGSSAEVQQKLQDHIPWVHKAPISTNHPLLDLGCGRGDWLALLREHGIPAQGLDTLPDALAQADAQGLTVHHADALEYLKELPSAALGAISAIHVIEHIPMETLLAWLAEARRVLVPGGLLLLETPNPENLTVGACHFYTDPTHLRPLVPEMLAFTVSFSGFEAIQILRLHPVPDPHWFTGTGDWVGPMNAWFHGPRDFAIIAWTPNAYSHSSGLADNNGRSGKSAALPDIVG